MITGDISSPGTTERVVRRTLEFAARVGLGAWGLGQRRRRGRVYDPGEIHSVDTTSRPHEAFLDPPGRRAYGRAYGRAASELAAEQAPAFSMPEELGDVHGYVHGYVRGARLRGLNTKCISSPDAARNVARLARLATNVPRRCALPVIAESSALSNDDQENRQIPGAGWASPAP